VKNLFCWVCRKFAGLCRSTASTNTHTISFPLLERQNATIIRGRRPCARQESDKCWSSYSNPVGNDVDPPLDLSKNASSSVGWDQSRDERDTGNSLSSELVRKRKTISDNDTCQNRRFQQITLSIDPDATKRRALPESRGNRSHQDRTPPPFSPLVPRSKKHNMSRETFPRATTTVTIPAAEEASESNAPPWTFPVASPTTEGTVAEEHMGDTVASNSQVEVATEHISEPGTPPGVTEELDHTVLGEDEGDIAPPGTTLATMPTTEATDVEEPMGDIDAPHHCPEVTAPETTSAQVEHSNSHRHGAKENKLKTWNKSKEVRLRKAIFEWLDPDMKNDKAHYANEAIQLIQVALEEDSQRLNETWKTSFERNCEKIRGWIDFVLKVQRYTITSDEQDLATNVSVIENNLNTDGLHGSKLYLAITNAQTAWYETHSESKYPELEDGLGLLLRDVVFPQKKHQFSQDLGACLEKLLVDFNNSVMVCFTL
jgi:hypothetical protein